LSPILYIKSMLSIDYIILYCSMVIWLFPPMKNRGTEYFAYFLLLAIADPVNVLTSYLIHIQRNFLSLMFGFFFAASLVKSKKTQYAFLALSFLLPVGLYVMKMSPMVSFYISTSMQVVIVFIVAMRIVMYLKQNYSLNIFLCILMIYVSITVLMRIAVIVNLHQGSISFVLGGAIQILFGLAFIFININTKNFKLVKEPAEEIS
jgi:hypothetical protein